MARGELFDLKVFGIAWVIIVGILLFAVFRKDKTA